MQSRTGTILIFKVLKKSYRQWCRQGLRNPGTYRDNNENCVLCYVYCFFRRWILYK
jgi:hypothetical protein